jgi:hypothetical protein
MSTDSSEEEIEETLGSVANGSSSSEARSIKAGSDTGLTTLVAGVRRSFNFWGASSSSSSALGESDIARGAKFLASRAVLGNGELV